MTTDMSQFYQVFFEETEEHLNEMERLLLGLDLDAPNPDELNAIFRAAHSIKGSSGTFGFTDMTGVTHILENLLDRIRKNELGLTSNMVDEFLIASDVLRGQLAGHQHGAEVDPQAATAVCASLKKLAEGKAAPPQPPAQKPAAAPESAKAATLQRLRIDFHPGAQTMESLAKNLEALFNDLKTLGQLEVTELDASGGTRAWSMTLATAAGIDAVNDIFSFFAQSNELQISLAEPPTDDELGYGLFGDEAPQADAAAADEGFGFFEPIEDQSKKDDAQGYGFFEDIKPPVEEPAPGTPETPPPAPADAQPESEPKFTRRATDRAPATESASIRVSIEKVDQLINLVGELVITQAMLAQTASGVDPALFESLTNGLSQLERNTRDLQESVMSIRMMPISFVFSRFPRLVRDLASKLGKDIELVTIGEGTELDKSLIEKITDPLTHLVRNSLDHGIEMAEERIAAGKSPQGKVTLAAAHQGGNIVISVSDDGAGLNRQKILKKAREKGIPVHDGMSDSDVWQLIFAPGFSTADVVTDVSGRGVGMDVVKKNILAMNGTVEIDSSQGHGSRFTIRLPLTLAILDGMSIDVGGQVFIVPLTFITESLQPTEAEVKTVSGRGRVVHVRGEYLPLVALHEVFAITPRVTEAHQGIVVLLEAEGKKAAMLVDELVGQHQVVIKTLETNYRKVPGISAATIMGDGRVALILDVGALVRISQH